MAVRWPFTGSPVAPPAAGPTLAVDVSNYTGYLTPEDIQAWRDLGIGLVIIQCFPRNTSQYAIQTQQMWQCAAAGMRYEGYIYDYLGDPSWRDGALAGLAVLSALHPKRIWADEEDVSNNGLKALDRANAIKATLDAITTAGFDRGIYTGMWWWKGYMNNSTAFKAEPLWDSHYDGQASTQVFTPYGGWTNCTYKQYMGTSTLGGVGNVDLDVTS